MRPGDRRSVGRLVHRAAVALAALAALGGSTPARAQAPSAPIQVTLEFSGSFSGTPSFGPGQDIGLLFTIENTSGASILTTSGFSTTEHWRRIVFRDRQGRAVINEAEALTHATRQVFQCLSRNGVTLPTAIPVVPIEVLPPGFARQYTIAQAQTFFDLTHPERYVGSAAIPILIFTPGDPAQVITDCDQFSGQAVVNVGAGTTAQGLTVDSSSVEFVIVNTPTGAPVTIEPEDALGNKPVMVTFGSVTEAGDTSLTTSSVGPAPPEGFQLGSPPVYFNLATSAVGDPVEVCIGYASLGTTYTDESQLHLFQFEGATWQDRTRPDGLDTTAKVICGNVDSLSTFAVLEPAAAPSLDTTPPLITVRVPAPRQAFRLHQMVAADYECQDEAGGSGLASCAGTVPDGAQLDTASLGAKQFMVRAEDVAGNAASVTRSYSVVSSLPVRPVLECVSRPSEGFVARFGYQNPNPVQIWIPIGPDNRFTPSPEDRGQPTVFEPGLNRSVFTVPFTSGTLAWKLGVLTVTASQNSPRCR